MHEQSVSPSQQQPGSLTFEFKNEIPSAHVAGRLKFGLEALPGVQRMSFCGLTEIVVMVDVETLEVEEIWAVIAGAGFAADEVVLRDGLLMVAPVELDEAPPEGAFELQQETVAA